MPNDDGDGHRPLLNHHDDDDELLLIHCLPYQPYIEGRQNTMRKIIPSMIKKLIAGLWARAGELEMPCLHLLLLEEGFLSPFCLIDSLWVLRGMGGSIIYLETPVGDAQLLVLVLLEMADEVVILPDVLAPDIV